MRSFIVSLSSEFYKSRKTLAFWSAILLPLLICVLISFGFVSNATKLANDPSMLLWFRYITAILGVMGVLLLPILVIYNTYAITNMEYKGDTWKSLFSLPLSKFSIYSSKYIYIVFLTFLTMLLFCLFIITTGHVIEFIKPELEFSQYNPNTIIFKYFTKLFLSVIGIVSIQFLLNLMWNDFLKPFGIGFILIIVSIITVNVGWKYVDYMPYAFPNLTVFNIMKSGGKVDKFLMFDQPIYNSLIYGAIFFIIGYFLLARKTIK
jgi:hypothetical protein